MPTGDIVITTQAETFDVDWIHQVLSSSYWAQNIPRSVVARSIENSLCFGVILAGRQIGFARLITDYATFAYLADVFIAEGYRGRGFGQRLIRHILEHPDVAGLRRILLATKDAQDLYRMFGFVNLANPQEYMTIHRPEVYR